MLKEALQFFETLSTNAKRATLLAVPGDGRVAYVDQAGRLDKIDVTPPLRDHKVDTVADLITAANRFSDDTKGTVWISEAAAVLVTDDADRRERVTLPLKFSNAFDKLTALERNPKLEQDALIRLLRVDLIGAVNRADLLTAVRKIKFRRATSGESNLQHGNESLGKQIENEITGAGTIPESVTVECSVYANAGERDHKCVVMCDLEIVASDGTFRFRPLPDELAIVKQAALAGIRERIDEATTADVFFGTP